MSSFEKINDNLEVEEDFLDVDPNIPGQNYCCLSFVSPEKLLKKRETFIFTEFMKDLVKDKQTPENVKFREKTDLMELIKKGELSYDIFKEAYDNFTYANGIKLFKKFNNENDFQTSVRGVKIRGVYDSLREAQKRAKILQRRDKNFHVFVGQVGYWLPWDPEADNVENQEYQEKHLNTLVKKYNENKEERDEIYDKNKRDALERAERENKKKNEQKAIEVVQDAKEDSNVNEVGNESVDEIIKDGDEDKKKIDEFREILNKKDGKYDELMAGNKIDPWLHHKLGQNKELNMSDGIKLEENEVVIDSSS